MQPLAALDGAGASVGRTPVIISATLSLSPGTGLGIVGPNGSGKSTLLRIIATLLSPDRGHGQVLGARLGTSDVIAVRSRIGHSGHTPALIPHLSLEENLAFFARLHGQPREKAQATLETVGLGAARTRLANACSAGMKRRADLARLLLHPVQLLLLDEPLDTLDRSARPLVNQVIDQVRAGGGAAVVVTHDRNSLPEVDQVLELTDGVIG